MRGRHLRNRRACIEPAAQRADELMRSDRCRPSNAIICARSSISVRSATSTSFCISTPRRCRSVAISTIFCAAATASCCCATSVCDVCSDVTNCAQPSASSTVLLYSPIATSACATSAPSFAFSRPRSKIGSEIAGPMEPASASREQRRGREREHAAERDEVHIRIELCARRIGIRERGFDTQARGDDVGPAPQEIGRQPRGQRAAREHQRAAAAARAPGLGPTARRAAIARA